MSFLMWSDRGTIPLIILLNFDIHFSAFLIRHNLIFSPEYSFYCLLNFSCRIWQLQLTSSCFFGKKSSFQVQQSRTYSENLISLMCILPGGSLRWRKELVYNSLYAVKISRLLLILVWCVWNLVLTTINKCRKRTPKRKYIYD